MKVKEIVGEEIGFAGKTGARVELGATQQGSTKARTGKKPRNTYLRCYGGHTPFCLG